MVKGPRCGQHGGRSGPGVRHRRRPRGQHSPSIQFLGGRTTKPWGGKNMHSPSSLGVNQWPGSVRRR